MYDPEVYQRYKLKNAERLPEIRQKGYINYKEAHPEKIAEIRKQASKKFYEANKEKVKEQNLQRYHNNKVLKKSGIVAPVEQI